MTDRPLVLSIVLNGVLGDSRVLKTAQAAVEGGYDAVVLGVGDVPEPTEQIVEGVRVILHPAPIPELKQRGAWASDYKPMRLMVEMAARVLLPTVRRLKPDLIHSHDMLGLRVGHLAARAVAADGKAVPWVHDLHEYVAGLTTIPPDTIAMCVEFERQYIRQVDGLITVSQALAERVQELYRLDPITVVLNAPVQKELAGPDVRTTLALPEGVPLVVYVGGAKMERGCATFVEATSRLPGVHICFVSESTRYIQSLRDFAGTLGMADRFHSLPYVASDQVASFIRTADIGVHGLIHYPNGEVALPNKLFEYLHAGLPVVVSDVAEMKRFVNERAVGEVFVAEDAADCMLALQRVLEAPEKYRRAISGELLEEFSWQTQALRLREVYSAQLVARPRRRLVLADEEIAVEGADFGLVSPVQPQGRVAFYLDPGNLHALAGLPQRLAMKYNEIEIRGCPNWPSPLAIRQLERAGVVVSEDTEADASLLDREQELLAEWIAVGISRAAARRQSMAAERGAAVRGGGVVPEGLRVDEDAHRALKAERDKLAIAYKKLKARNASLVADREAKGLRSLFGGGGRKAG